MYSGFRVNLRTVITLAVITLILIASYLSIHIPNGRLSNWGTSKTASISLLPSSSSSLPSPSISPSPSPASSLTPPKKPVGIQYKDDKLRPLAARPFVRTNETFPDAATARSPSDLPPVPRWNLPPSPHVEEKTPIYVGFTRNWPLLQQTVVSLIVAGWPPSDIYVVENTGVMDANIKGRLSLQNPFYLDHHRLTKILQVNVLVTPSLQTFAQLQNFFLFHAISNNWPMYFWSHMDIIVQNSEEKTPYQSFYMKAVNAMRRAKGEKWALKYFAYDWVTLMNTHAMEDLGGWDTMISYYTTDCDMYDRMRMYNYTTDAVDCGPVYDTGESLKDLKELYRVGDDLNSTTYYEHRKMFETMTHVKNNGALGPRNRWQVAQRGGQGEPWYRDMDGFAEALEIQVQAGIEVYGKKWHAKGCGIIGSGLKAGDEWMVEAINEP